MNAPVTLTAVAASLALISLGGGLYEFLVVDPFWPKRPDLIQPARGGISRKRFWIPAHFAFELVLIAALVSAWPLREVRFWLPVALASHAVMRIWSAFDFIPKALAFERAEPDSIGEAAARKWARRSLLRVPLDLVTCASMPAAFAEALRRWRYAAKEMRSVLLDSLKLKYSPLAVILTGNKPAAAQQFKPGGMGCVAAMLLAAAKGRTVAFDRDTFGCPGGGVALGFGNAYAGFPIDRLLSTGGRAELGNGQAWDMGEGERFFESPEVTCRWVAAVPLREIPAKYVVAMPLDQARDGERPALVWLLVNPDQMSALVTQIGFRRGSVENVVAPWCAACQSILFAYAECEKDQPRAVLGWFDISQRHRVSREILSLTIPYRLFLEMEANAGESFLRTEAWRKLRERQ